MMRTLQVAAVGAALVLVQACGMSAAVLDQRAEGTFDRTLTLSGRVDLDVTTGSGRIDVRTGQADRVEIHGRITASDWSLRSGKLSPEERVKRLQANPPIEQTGNRIRIGRIADDDLRNVSVSYTLVVPAQTALVSTTGSGSLEISGLSDVRASTGSGSIDAHGIGGTFQASTGSGRIEVSKTGKGDVEVSTGSGSIEVTGVNGGLRASTGSGSLRVQGEQTSDWRLSTSSGSINIELSGKPAFTLDASSSSGSIDTAFPVTVSGKVSKRELRGPVNGGGPLLHLRTSSGGIRIR